MRLLTAHDSFSLSENINESRECKQIAEYKTKKRTGYIFDTEKLKPVWINEEEY